MRFYVIGYGTCEESEKLVVFTNEKLTKKQLTDRVLKAVVDMLNDGEPEDAFDRIDYQEEKEKSSFEVGIRTQDVISSCLYPYLEKYNLKKVEMDEQIWFWGWNDTAREGMWAESEEHDHKLIDLMKEVVEKYKKNKRGKK